MDRPASGCENFRKFRQVDRPRQKHIGPSCARQATQVTDRWENTHGASWLRAMGPSRKIKSFSSFNNQPGRWSDDTKTRIPLKDPSLHFGMWTSSPCPQFQHQVKAMMFCLIGLHHLIGSFEFGPLSHVPGAVAKPPRNCFLLLVKQRYSQDVAGYTSLSNTGNSWKFINSPGVGHTGNLQANQKYL